MSVKFSLSLFRQNVFSSLNARATGTTNCSGRSRVQKRFLLRRFSTSYTNLCSEYSAEFEYEVKSVDDLDAIAGDDPAKIKAVKILALEMDLLRQTGNSFIPKKLTTSQWNDLLEITDRTDRECFYKTVCDVMKIMKTTTIQSCNLQTKSTDTNSIFLHEYESKIEQVHDYRLAMAQILGPHLLVDCSYESCLKLHELISGSVKLSSMWNLNRRNSRPFNITFCNVSETGKLRAKLSSTEFDSSSFINVSEKNYLDLFPASRLVFLTPFSKNDLGKFDDSCVYIMNAFVDNTPDTSSVTTAKRLGLRTVKFPIDKFLKWRGNEKVLPLDQCVAILNDVKNGASWQYAFRHIPREKLKDVDEEFMRKCDQSKKYYKRIRRPISLVKQL